MGHGKVLLIESRTTEEQPTGIIPSIEKIQNSLLIFG